MYNYSVFAPTNNSLTIVYLYICAFFKENNIYITTVIFYFTVFATQINIIQLYNCTIVQSFLLLLYMSCNCLSELPFRTVMAYTKEMYNDIHCVQMALLW